MKRCPKRIPNNCGILSSFSGRLPELKCLILILSKVWDYGKTGNGRFIPYSDFMVLGKSFRRGSGYISECIYDAVSVNKEWLDVYADVRNGKNGCFVEYTECMTNIAENSGTNFYQIYIDDVARFTSLFGLRMYLIYMRDRNRIAMSDTNSVTYTADKFSEITGCNEDNTVYRNIRRCRNEFMEITGIGIDVSKHKKNGYWNIIYNSSYIDSDELIGE